MKAWEQFVADHGARARARDLAHVLGRTAAEIEALRRLGVCARRRKKSFVELFTLWHGRAPREADWPALERDRRGHYEWQGPELALLATLVGTMGTAELAKVLTARLRKVTGDRRACRKRMAIQNAINRMGLQAADVVGGITAAAAGREICSYGSVLHAIENGDLPVRRVGNLMVIPHKAWAAWKAARPQPPADYVRLAPVFRQLGISSDSKPQEFAVHVPTAQQFHPFGQRGGTSRRGVWFIKGAIARQLVADRRAGRPMPWHGKPIVGNMKQAWDRLQRRRHPSTCAECRRILGDRRPASFEEFCRLYPALSLGDKRHITRRWLPGVTIRELAAEIGYHPNAIVTAIRNGALRAKKYAHRWFVTRTDATRWKARRCPSGDGQHSWLSPARAKDFYGFKRAELEAFIRAGKLKSKRGAFGQLLVARQQCVELREAIGYTEREAARRCKLTVPRFRRLLRGLDLDRRGQRGRIRLDVVRNVERRLAAPPGKTFDEVAAEIKKPAHWIRYQLRLGRIEVVRAKWDHKQLYLTKATIERLRQLAARHTRRRPTLGTDWLLLSEAARHAGVSTGTVRAWVREGGIRQRRGGRVMHYRRPSIEARAGRYWRTQRFKRATPPAWLAEGSTWT